MQYITSSALDGLHSFSTQASDVKEYIITLSGTTIQDITSDALDDLLRWYALNCCHSKYDDIYCLCYTMQRMLMLIL